ncbi:sensor histidine kinase [Actinocorallia libanotica]|uniref:Carrier domain-containing protein n=1 Tax=Actinocorallia libanotica TaxID=46162 RepID=A0ABN1Q8V0_9ACTN
MELVFGYAPEGTRRRSPRLGRAIGLSLGVLYLIPLIGSIAELSGAKRILAALTYTAFLALYYAVCLVRDTWHDAIGPRTWALYALFLTVAVTAPPLLGPDFDAFLIYPAVVSAIFLPKRWTLPAIAACSLAAFAVSEAIGTRQHGVLIVTATTFSLGVMMLAFRHSRELVEQLREARAEVARLAAAEERLRIARDLHDLLGHSLSLIALKSELATRLAERDPSRAASEMRDVNGVAREALRDVRETVTGYRRRTLAEELDSARSVLTAAGVEPVVNLSGTPLPEPHDALFAWAVRECVTNVVRHARARRCEITVTSSFLEVTDDGRAEAAAVPGNGLRGLRERAAELGGTVQTAPRPSGGFMVRVGL